MSTRAEFRRAWSMVRKALRARSHEVDEEMYRCDPLMLDKAVRCWTRRPRKFGVEASRTAPDFKTAIRLNLDAARFRRRNRRLAA